MLAYLLISKLPHFFVWFTTTFVTNDNGDTVMSMWQSICMAKI